MRILWDARTGLNTAEATEEELHAAYAVPATPWLRANFVQTVDGAATGESGRSGSINNAADKRIFDLLRAQADVIVVGAGTARTEGYHVAERPLVVVTSSGRLPESLRSAPAGTVLAATYATAPGVAELVDELGEPQVLVLGEREVVPARMKSELVARGFGSILSEGGPALFVDLLRGGVVDEVCTTTVPRLVGGDHLRIAHGLAVDVDLSLVALLEENGTLAQRWFVES